MLDISTIKEYASVIVVLSGLAGGTYVGVKLISILNGVIAELDSIHGKGMKIASDMDQLGSNILDSKNLMNRTIGFTQAAEAWQEIPGLMRATFKVPPNPYEGLEELWVEKIKQDITKKAQDLKTDNLEDRT